MIEFTLPWSLLLLPLPLLVRRWLPPARLWTQPLYFPRAAHADSMPSSTLLAKPHGAGRRATMLLIWLLLVTAATGPRWVGDAVQLPASGRDLMLAVDISESMQIEDMELNGQRATRLAIIKAVVGEFVRRRVGDRLGLILFGSNAYLHVPLTFDRNTVGRLLEEARIGFAGKQTAIGDAIGIAIKRLRDRPANSRVVILLTDGANTAGQIAPRQAAELAHAQGLRIYTIGIGAEEMELPGLFGSSFGARRVNPSADLDEDMLKYIATTTGGRYFRARNQSELASVYAELDRIEPVEQESETYRPLASLAHWPLVAAMLLACGMALPALLRQRRSAPRATADGVPAA